MGMKRLTPDVTEDTGPIKGSPKIECYVKHVFKVAKCRQSPVTETRRRPRRRRRADAVDLD